MTLPDSICKLFNLQTLRILNLYGSFKNFPLKFQNLISLRHLHFDFPQGFQMPFGIGRLTDLQTLSCFNIGQDNGCRISELGCLSYLGGVLKIRNLELVKTTEEAKSANLCGKPNMYQLEFYWGKDRQGENQDENILEGLRPHPNLRSLKIENFMGNQFPLWAMKMAANTDNGWLALENLVEVQLIHCKRCKEIPMLGQLPLLRHLILQGLNNVTTIGPSTYGTGYYNGSRCSTSNAQGMAICFPALENLILEEMPNLVEWMDVSMMPSSSTAEASRVSLFPHLQDLTIINCPNLRTTPSNFPCLTSLRVFGNNSILALSSICCSVSTLVNIKILGLSELICLPDSLFQNNPKLACITLGYCSNLTNIVSSLSGWAKSLRILVIEHCVSLIELPKDLHSLQSLEILTINGCDSLMSIPAPEGQGLCSLRHCDFAGLHSLTSIPGEAFQFCTSLESLSVRFCNELIAFPLDLQKLPSLTRLSLIHCPKLSTMPKGLGGLSRLRQLSIGGFLEFDSFQTIFSGIEQYLSSIHELELIGWPHWDSLPDQIQYLPFLTQLDIRSFGVETLPNWFGNLSSLETLRLSHCEKLYQLLSVEAMGQMIKLRKIMVSYCPLLKDSCSQRSNSNSQWSRISHIPEIIID